MAEAPPVPDFCWTCGEVFPERAVLDAHQLATGHELDQPDHPLHHREENAMTEPALWSLGNGELLSVAPGSGTTYTLPLSELLEMNAEEAIACDYRMPDDPEALDFRVAAILPDKRRDPWYPSLVEDIRIHGLRTPIWIYKDEISDGCHRIAAAQDLGIEYLLCTDVPPDDPEAGVSVFDASTKTWIVRGWVPGKRGGL